MTKPYRTILLVVLAGALVFAAAAAAAVSQRLRAADKTLVVTGYVYINELVADDSCPIPESIQALVTDKRGVIIATGEVRAGLRVAGKCRHEFRVADVPAGLAVYGVEVGTSGRRLYAESLVTQQLRFEILRVTPTSPLGSR